MAKKKIGVTIEESLHLAIKSEAPRRGTNIEKAYEEALTAWLAASDVKQRPSWLPEVSLDNRGVIAWLIDLFERKGTLTQEALKAALRDIVSTSKQAKGKAAE